MAYAVLAEGRSQEELEELDASIGMTENAEMSAMAELNTYRESMGLEPLSMPAPWNRDGNEEIR